MYNFDDVLSKLDEIECKIDTLIDRESKAQSFQVIATKGKTKLPVADYVFDEMQDAVLFYKQMKERGYDVVMEQKWT